MTSGHTTRTRMLPIKSRLMTSMSVLESAVLRKSMQFSELLKSGYSTCRETIDCNSGESSE